ncbi:MAG: hypothetical protein ACREPC_07095, partial [Stenotrophomonas sp.]
DAQDLAVDLVQLAGFHGHSRQPVGDVAGTIPCLCFKKQEKRLVWAAYTSSIMVPARSSAGNDPVGEVRCAF